MTEETAPKPREHIGILGVLDMTKEERAAFDARIAEIEAAEAAEAEKAKAIVQKYSGKKNEGKNDRN